VSEITNTGETGSFLIEALAALAIISSAVVLGLSGFADATARLRRTDDRLEALSLARNLMTETLGSTVSVPSERHGISDSGFSWSIRTYQESDPEHRYVAKLYTVIITVAKREMVVVILESTGISLERQSGSG
jgi:hypothetical protein